MTASRFEHPSHIRIFPDHGIFAITLLLFFGFTKILDSVLDYGEGTFPLDETNIMIIFVIVFFGGAAFGFYLLLFAILTIDSQSGIRIFSRFSTMDAKWDQIESLTLRLNLNLQRTPSRSGGLMMLFAIPYQYHTRPVTLRIKTILGKEKTFHLRINLTKINHLLTLLADVPVLEGRRSEVYISKKKKKKKDLIEIKTTKQANLRK